MCHQDKLIPNNSLFHIILSYYLNRKKEADTQSMMTVKEHCVLNNVCGDTTPVCGCLERSRSSEKLQTSSVGENQAAERKAKPRFEFTESKGTKPSSHWLWHIHDICTKHSNDDRDILLIPVCSACFLEPRGQTVCYSGELRILHDHIQVIYPNVRSSHPLEAPIFQGKAQKNARDATVYHTCPFVTGAHMAVS